MRDDGGRRVEVNLGHRCNNRCAFCMSGEQRDAKTPWADPDKVKEELRHFHERGCRSLGFLGGEPTVYPHILECMAYARDLGYTRIALCSNGTRMADADFCEKLVAAGLTRATLSVHSHRDAVEDDEVTRVPGNLAKKVAAIRNLVELRRRGRLPHNVSLNPVLSRRNLHDMPAYLAFFSALEVSDVRFNFIWPQGDAKEDRSWVPSYREAVPEIVKVMLLNEKRLGLRLTFGGVPKCVLRLAPVSPALAEHLAGKYLDECAFDPDNDVALAGGGGKPRFVWQEQKRDLLKARGPLCDGCRYSKGCDGVWRTYADMYGFEELRP